MQILLDTHALVWAILAPGRLSALSADLLQDTANELFVSGISAYELIQKHRTGKWPEVAVIADDFESAMARRGFIELPLTMQTMIRAAAFPSDHRDPWDRILAAQSLVSGIPLLSVDPKIDVFGVRRIWD